MVHIHISAPWLASHWTDREPSAPKPPLTIQLPVRASSGVGSWQGHPHNHLADVLCGRQLAQRIGGLLKREHHGRQGLDQACKPSRARLGMSCSQMLL